MAAAQAARSHITEIVARSIWIWLCRLLAGAEKAQLAKRLSTRLLDLDVELRQAFSGGRYLRHSEGAELRERIGLLVAHARPFLVRVHLTHAAALALQRLIGLEAADKFERERNAANERYVSAAVPSVLDAMKTLLDVKPTDEQAAAIATDEETTLVLAGAGTGKTRVISGKVAHLVRSQGVAPRDILVLAFNRSAADEVKERLGGELANVDVSTFHAFGRRVVAQASGQAPTISKLAIDESACVLALEQIIEDLISDPKQDRQVVEFIAYHRCPYSSPFDFKSPSDYYNYIRNIDRHALSGDKVKSFEELEVANFLALSGIRFEYESPYKVSTADTRHRQYQPDFYLPDYDIYIEHFALDEKGRPPPSWLGYGDAVAWKRAIHLTNRTRLIETHSWHCKQGSLRVHLRRQLEAYGVRFSPVPLRDLLRGLRNIIVSWLAKLIRTFLRHVKTAGLSISELRKRAAARPGALRNGVFLDLFQLVWDRYQALLTKEGALDFEDLINRASGLIGANAWSSPYRYVLVDEFQDISAGRMALLAALRRADVGYFLVGDDWQSINRFAGSDVGLMQQCGKYLGHVEQRELTQVFRYGESIILPSTTFIQRNPQQTKRSLRAAGKETGEGLTIVVADNQPTGIRTALADIAERTSDDKSQSVMPLGRYRRSQNDTPARLHSNFSTVHSSKGREADYAIVLDLKGDLYGFPSQIEDDLLIEMVLGDPSEFTYAEERRVFYVAMTRASRGVYLIADSERPSSFVDELRRGGLGLRQIGHFASDTAASRCPRCRGGSLVVSQSAKSLRCTNHPFCEHQAARCEHCKKGYVLVSNGAARCSNPVCGVAAETCPRCSTGVLRRKEGAYGPFWGCTEYWSEPPCRYTRTDHSVASDVASSWKD